LSNHVYTKGWEIIPDRDSFSTERMQVPGGWLVRSTLGGTGMAHWHVPDISHEWSFSPAKSAMQHCGNKGTTD
jgi:hypothetical protein